MGVINAFHLYRETHRTFKEYRKERWGFTKTYANNLIGGANVVININDNNCCQIPATD